MYYRMLGNTGLQVSVLSYGFWATFGVKEGLCDKEGIEKAKACLRVARAGGINLFDNAEVYGNPYGAAETIMGEAIAQLKQEDPAQWRRSDILITTKIFWGGTGVNEKGLSRKHIYEGIDSACSRLQVEYVDLVFCHRPDPFTPTATVVRAMTEQIRRGKAWRGEPVNGLPHKLQKLFGLRENKVSFRHNSNNHSITSHTDCDSSRSTRRCTRRRIASEPPFGVHLRVGF